jgi:hypothetical protein
MENTFLKYCHMIDIIQRSIPDIIKQLKSSLLDEYEQPDEYFHRIIDSNKRQVIDTKYRSMKEIVENVYYNVYNSPGTEHYLVKKNAAKHTENSIKLKCKGVNTLEMNYLD